MAKFTDSMGDEWQVSVDAFSLRQIKSELEVDLLDLSGGDWARLDSDLCLRVDVISLLCSDEAAGRQVTANGFAKRLTGEGLANATYALVDAVEEFLPPNRRRMLKALMAKYEELTAKGVELSLAKLDDRLTNRVMKDAERKIDAELDKQFGGD